MKLSTRCGALVLGLALGVGSGAALAADSAALLAAINTQRLELYQLQTLFHLRSIEEGSASVTAQLRSVSQDFASRVAQLDEVSAGLGLDADVAALQTDAQRFQQLVDSDEISEQGYVDLHTLNDLSDSGSALASGYDNLLGKLAQQGQASDPLQEQAILMRRIAAEYVRESASLDGGSAIYDSARDSERAVDALAVQFREQLTALDQRYASEVAVSTRLKQVGTTWAYIEKPLLNYKEKSVPNLVARYSDQIATRLIQ